VEASAPAAPDPCEGIALGVEEEFHVLDLESRELVARAPDLLAHLPATAYVAELHRSVVEVKSGICMTLDDLRADLRRTRALLVDTAGRDNLGVIAAGTVPLVDPDEIAVTVGDRFQQMLEDYKFLVREQLICGLQVHVQVTDRDLAVRLAARVAPCIPVLLALSASSPFWRGEDTGYASARSLVWQRWPTAGQLLQTETAAEHDQLVEALVKSQIISDAGMIYFDVRPSAHLPTLELRAPDACPDLDDVILVAGLFRALVRREWAGLRDSAATLRHPALLRAAMWRAARSGLEGDLLDLPGSPLPVPAQVAVRSLVHGLRGELEQTGDWEQVEALVERRLALGSCAAEQRRVLARRGRFGDVVDMLVARTAGAENRPTPMVGVPVDMDVFPGYPGAGDEVFGAASDPLLRETYEQVLGVVRRLGPTGMQERARCRDEEQRSNGVTFGVMGEASTRLFPVDLLPRVVGASDWAMLEAGLVQRTRALDAFLADVYGPRRLVADGVVPGWVIDTSPGLRSEGALLARQRVRAVVSGTDVVRDADGRWLVLEDNLRVPSGLGYAVQSRRLTAQVMPDLALPGELLPVEEAPRMLHAALAAAAPEDRDQPQVVLLSEGPCSSAWFEHRMLADEMQVPLAVTTDLVADAEGVSLLRRGARLSVDVLYLRIDIDELLHGSAADGRPLGPGVFAAAHAGRVALANAPGNGVADDKAVYAFVPELVRYYLGEEPLVPGVPTYPCGVPAQRERVMDRLSELVLKPVDGFGGQGVFIGPHATPAELDAVRRQVLVAPQRWVAQEFVALSTHPVVEADGLAPRQVDLRAFVLLSPQGGLAVPAALTRVAPEGSVVVNSSRGGGAKDTWLLGAEPTAQHGRGGNCVRTGR
jgi:carboxylate-amine ligase